MMSKLDNKKKFTEIYDTYKDFKVDRHEESELFWVQQGILVYINLFYSCGKIDEGTEQDLLDEVVIWFPADEGQARQEHSINYYLLQKIRSSKYNEKYTGFGGNYLKF
ncbi:hypothetical protein HPULCUR_002586 [Helicostylum pulchrum]|uniref:Uncharacterized protein n=1 Tax=Helicostylum pulchrum TaxID=562976 RepID=A0ABP9XR04_9FUNG